MSSPLSLIEAERERLRQDLRHEVIITRENVRYLQLEKDNSLCFREKPPHFRVIFQISRYVSDDIIRFTAKDLKDYTAK